MLKAPGKSNGKTGTKILLDAISKDKVHLARFVLDALDGEIVDSKEEGAQTPLISSVLLPDAQARCKFAELLLHRGASVNCRDGNGRTALSHACEQGHLDAVKILVRNSADPEIVDSWGNTALMYAAVAGHAHVVEFLVRAFKRLGLQIDRQNKVGNSAIGVAKFLGHTECICALTNNSKKGREDGGARGSAQLRPGELEKKVGHLADRLEVLRACNHAHCLLAPNCTRQPIPRIKRSGLPSMNSIEEFETENEGASSPPPDLVLSEVSTLAPRPCILPNLKHPKTEGRPTTSDDPLPPLTMGCEAQRSTLFSPRPSRNSHRPSAPSALGILMTPILANKSENELATERTKMLDFGLHRFPDSYYKKRCSLPTSMLSPAPPERTLVPLRKSRTVRRRERSPGKAEPPQAPTASSAAATFSVLSNKMLRRFTFPEFEKDAKELEQDPTAFSMRIPRSETFPQAVKKHPQVDSKASIDSISSVKCEFDFHVRKTNA